MNEATIITPWNADVDQNILSIKCVSLGAYWISWDPAELTISKSFGPP
jgi:hypothetical protein